MNDVYYPCKRCNGTGLVCQSKNECNRPDLCDSCGYSYTCSQCLGKGMLDWVEKIVGPNLDATISSVVKKKRN